MVFLNLIFILLHLLVVCSQNANPFFNWVDCSYDKDTAHVEYICEGDIGSRFNRRNDEFLCCNNYKFGIDRKTVRMLSFRECRGELPIMEPFVNLRTFNLSFTGRQHLNPIQKNIHKYLENFIVSNNELSEIPVDLFKFTSEIIEIDFSYNKIRAVDPFMFENIHKIKTVRFAHNKIAELHNRLFSNLPNLEFMDFSDNRIGMIENNLFVYNKKLKSVNFMNNQIKRLDCEFLLTLMNMRSLNVSLNTLVELKTDLLGHKNMFVKMDCANESMNIDLNVTLSTNEIATLTSTTTLKIADGKFEWIFSKADFNKIRYLNFSNSRHMKNIPLLLEEASTELITLDLSNTFVSKLNEKTFQRFTNLQYLYLSRTNLSNFQFATFYQQTKLKVLDLSYNNLNSIDFHLFERTFQNLKSLHLEGNNLTEIDTLKSLHLEKLTTLAISKNHFTCEYLAQFLSLWPKLKLIHNPSNQTVHMGGVDCIHENRRSAENINFNDLPVAGHIKNNPEKKMPNNVVSEDHLKELYAIKILLTILAFMISFICFLFTMEKCKRFTKFCGHWKRKEFIADSVLFVSQENKCNKCNKIENIYSN